MARQITRPDPAAPDAAAYPKDAVQPGQRAGGTESEPEQPAAASGSEAAGNAAAVITHSGVYRRFPAPFFTSETLKVDIDGQFPAMAVSGEINTVFTGRLAWIARVTAQPNGGFAGSIFYKRGNTALLPQTNVSVSLTAPVPWTPSVATAIFTGGGGPSVRAYRFESAYFRDVEMEFDTVEDATAVTAFYPPSHPNRPADLPSTTMTITSTFARQGINTATSAMPGGDDVIPLAAAGADALWSDLEMHDAMQVQWSRWSDTPQWAIWTLFARQHEIGPGLGGIMFDTFGAAQRQGCAIFSDSFISEPPVGDPFAAAYVERMRFWTAMHEIGHCFNLAHSWQKSLGAPWGSPWIPLADEPDARSFMNYPFAVPGGPAAFFADFYYRFSDIELLFLRHAPFDLVEQGNAPWFDQHGFEQVRRGASADLSLDLRVHRPARYEYLEPVYGELELTNSSSLPKVVDRNILTSDALAIVVTSRGQEPKRWLPFARHCLQPDPVLLSPGESLYAQVLLSAGQGGWHVAEAGRHTVFAALGVGAEPVLSRPLTVEVAQPASSGDERVAAELFTEDVARALAFGGSRVLDRANDTLRDIVDRMPGRRVAIHAAAALGSVAARPGKVLRVTDDGRLTFDLTPASPATAAAMLGRVYTDPDSAAATLGHIGVVARVDAYGRALAAEGRHDDAERAVRGLGDVLAHRGVLPSVVADVRARSYRNGG